MNKGNLLFTVALLLSVASVLKAAEDFTVINNADKPAHVMIYGMEKGQRGMRGAAGVLSFGKIYYGKIKPGDKWHKILSSRIINVWWSLDEGNLEDARTWTHVYWDSKAGQVNMKKFYIIGQRNAMATIGRAGIPNFQNVNFTNLMPAGSAELKSGGIIKVKERPAS